MVTGAEFQAVVLMPNHIHMLVTVPELDLGRMTNVFFSSLTRTLNLISGRSGRAFGARYHWSLIDSSRYYSHALKYVYRNPVRAGIVPGVETWPYSTLYGLIGLSHLPFPVSFTRAGLELGLPSIEACEQLEWLNRPFPREAEELIQRGLRRKTFEAVKDRRTRLPAAILDHLL